MRESLQVTGGLRAGTGCGGGWQHRPTGLGLEGREGGAYSNYAPG